ncbi:hypothetical protein DL766_010006 [Monosporascus sp. MC13-8B]|uniref:Uncharacterized protein n=1 Tax=Monosporascus cannonballus TaxID=155416 RepID=A0ABY0GT90_9PEZI|nr:hypothetical protein DL762_009599 [Monosporascus cannonballus]RYO78239.1 hypothetical protein DL763_009727 [Monosporascus cannonballus]RYP11963.1 hypothetical protein DL766_010006 [Monosporascus sp. MC13-8B]
MQPRTSGAYTMGPPLDGGAGPGVLAGNHPDVPATAVEIGIIIGVVLLIIITVVSMFVWRARRQKRAAVNQATAAPQMHRSSEDIVQPAPLPKDDRDAERFSTIDSDKFPSVRQPSCSTPIMNWKSWGKHARRGGMEEHEMKNRI